MTDPDGVACPHCDYSSPLDAWPGAPRDAAVELAEEMVEFHRAELHPTVNEIRERWATAHPGPWLIDRESCDCGGDYPCSHGQYPYALNVPNRNPESRYAPSEIAEMRDVDIDAISHAAIDISTLLAEIDRLTDLADTRARAAQQAGALLAAERRVQRTEQP